MSAPRIVVIGGGLAGLSAAIEATDLGGLVTLVERRPRLGGATWSFEHNGRWFDNGQHVFLRCCTAYRGFLDRIGASDDVVLQDRLALPVVAPGGHVAWLRRHRGRPPLHLARSLLGYRHLSRPERVRAALAATQLARVDRDDPRHDETTFGEWLEAHGQSARAIERFWDLIVRPTVNLPSAEASLAIAATVFQIAFLTDAPAADIGWARVPLAALHAAPAQRALLASGAAVHTGRGARRVELTGGGPSVVLDDGSLDADAVIVAVPHDRVGSLLPSGLLGDQARLGELGSSAIVNVHLTYDRRVLPYPMAAVLDPLVQFVFDRTAAADVSNGQHVAVSLSGADAHLATPSRVLISAVTSAVARAFPAARDATVVDALVTREPSATFRATPGSRALRPGIATASPVVFVAGAWTDTGWPATMEGAVRSGTSAARAAIASLRSEPSPSLQEVPS